MNGVVREQRSLDPLIDAVLAQTWPLKRIEAILRAVLRAGAFELGPARRAGAGGGGRICRCRQCLRRPRGNRHGQCRARPDRPQIARGRIRNGGMTPMVEYGSRTPQSGEDRLIARYFRPLATDPGALGLLDDAATITPPPGLATSCSRPTPSSAACISSPTTRRRDLPRRRCASTCPILPQRAPAPPAFCWRSRCRQVGETGSRLRARPRRGCRRLRCPLLGGDTDRTPGPVTISIAAFGIVPHGTMVRRSGARAGDLVFVTGTIGDAALGLVLRRDPAAASAGRSMRQRDHLIARYLVPQPRNALAEALRLHASAAMDVSDGLAGDLGKLCRVSGWRPISRPRACRCRTPRARCCERALRRSSRRC